MSDLTNIDALSTQESRRRLVVTQREIDKWISIRLQAAGFDMSREVMNWSLLDEKGTLSIVYEQRVDAPLTQEAQTSMELNNRPAYLRRD